MMSKRIEQLLCRVKISKDLVLLDEIFWQGVLHMSAEKCCKIHIGKKCDQCQELKVHKNDMKDSQKEKYLGDIISEKGTAHFALKKKTKKSIAWNVQN